jgi:hypothetical protein
MTPFIAWLPSRKIKRFLHIETKMRKITNGCALGSSTSLIGQLLQCTRSDHQILSKQYKIKSQNIKTKKNKKKVNHSQALNW